MDIDMDYFLMLSKKGTYIKMIGTLTDSFYPSMQGYLLRYYPELLL